jgi:hypothetical protein
VADADPVPPVPVQLSEYCVVAVSAGVVNVPLVARVPVQPPEAVQLVALVDVQVSVEVWPLCTLVGEAVSVTVGAADALPTVTVVEADALPPAPVQLSVNWVVAVRAPVADVPLVPRAPVQPPEASQDVAFVDDHVSVVVWPFEIDAGLALRLTVGADGDCVGGVAVDSDPPPPPQAACRSATNTTRQGLTSLSMTSLGYSR